MRMNKVAVFALDGATFEVIEPAVREGRLPTLARLLEEGAHGALESTIPPITGAAWTSFQTGVNPGRHGAFDWLTRAEDYRLRPISSEQIKQLRLWEAIGLQGGRVIVLGVPVTWPPYPVNGVLVTGLLTPQGAEYTYPLELRQELEHKVGRFPTMPEHWRGRYQARRWLAGLKQGIELRTQIAKYLLKTHEWDFFMLHFMETDSVQHQAWHLLDGQPRPRYRAGLTGNPVLEIYEAVDAALAELLAELPSETVIFVISDHGFGPLFWNVYVNNWLLENGYMKLRRGFRSGWKRAAFRFGLTQERLFPWAERLRLLGRGAQLRHNQLNELLGRFFISFADVDWERTYAYSYGNIGQIYLNLAGREPRGIVKPEEAEHLIAEIASGLTGLKNPETQEPVIAKIYRKEELYHGERLAEAPEIIFLPRRGYMTLGATEFASNRVIAPTFAGSGWHELEGVFIAAGPGIARGEIHGLRLIDLYPTILHALELAIPRGLDGKPALEVFVEEKEPRFKDFEVERAPAGEGAETERERREWEAEVQKRLQDLGYI